jgi:DNA-binding transcriptional MerR regulator
LADTPRYSEPIELIPPVHRNHGGIPDYSNLDTRRIELITRLHNESPIEVLIEFYASDQQGDETIEARKAILIGQRAELIARMIELQ